MDERNFPKKLAGLDVTYFRAKIDDLKVGDLVHVFVGNSVIYRPIDYGFGIVTGFFADARSSKNCSIDATGHKLTLSRELAMYYAVRLIARCH